MKVTYQTIVQICDFYKNIMGADVEYKWCDNNKYVEIKVYGKNAGRFYGKDRCGISWRKDLCGDKEWEFYIKGDKQIVLQTCSFRGLKLNYQLHDYNWYIDYIHTHIQTAINKGKYQNL